MVPTNFLEKENILVLKFQELGEDVHFFSDRYEQHMISWIFWVIMSFLDIRIFWALVDTRRSLGRDGPAVVVANATVAWCVFRGRTVALRRRNDV